MRDDARITFILGDGGVAPRDRVPEQMVYCGRGLFVLGWTLNGIWMLMQDVAANANGWPARKAAIAAAVVLALGGAAAAATGGVGAQCAQLDSLRPYASLFTAAQVASAHAWYRRNCGAKRRATERARGR